MKSRELPPIVTPSQMRAIDDRAISTHGIPALALMENAGGNVASYVRDQVVKDGLGNRRIAVICGPGNNGGDGLVVARYLSNWGAAVSVYLLGRAGALSGPAKANCDRLLETGIKPKEIIADADVPAFEDIDIAIDAIYGTGFHGITEGVVAKTISALNASGVDVVAVDIPSGVNGETGAASTISVRARHTVALALPKRGHFLWPGRGHIGQFVVADIGIPRDEYVEALVQLRVITHEFVRAALPARPPDAHKGIFGKSLVIGGSGGMSGSVVLACRAALKTGVGLSYASVPESLVDTVNVGAVETVVKSLPEVRTKRAIARRALGEVLSLFREVDAVAVGPGFGRHHESQELVRRLVTSRTRPMVLDADGLNACANDTSVLMTDNSTPLILTPHAEEMARLLGRDVTEIVADREAAAREAARQFNAIVVMKGAPTFVAEPSGETYLNPNGNSGMATGGTGDVLTGMIVSLLAQGVEPLSAALAGVFLHGLSGDIAASEYGERSLVASDLITALPFALKSLTGVPAHL